MAGERFDLIIANPPYVPAPALTEPPDAAPARWNAGHDGRAVIDRLIARRAPAHLEPGGCVLLVQSSVTGPRETLDAL